MSQHSSQMEKLNKIIKTLEEELTAKADKIKSQEAKIGELKMEGGQLMDRVKDIQKQYDKLKKEN